MGEEMRGLKSTNEWLQNSHGDVKYSIGNKVTKEYTCMTHGHGQQCGDCLRECECRVERGKGLKIGTTVTA